MKHHIHTRKYIRPPKIQYARTTTTTTTCDVRYRHVAVVDACLIEE
jgi:hypothetical protein